MTTPDDLIQRLQQRDPEALTTVFETYADSIYRLALKTLHDEQEADGIVQTTFLKLIESVDRFEGRANIGTWLYRVAYNECMTRFRRQKPNVSLDALLDDDLMPTNVTDWNNLPDQLLYSQEAREQMEQAIQKLSPSLRAVFILRDVEGVSTRETATILDISESAVKVRLHRARLFLRETLADYFQELK